VGNPYRWPIFFCFFCRNLIYPSTFLSNLSIQTIIDDTLAGFAGVELVEIERLPKGLLSITIDEPNSPTGVSVAHCEQITRQLQAVFFVEEIAYERLEVGSPGVNRPLVKHADFVRFAGERATVKLREAFQNRKTYTGILQAPVMPASVSVLEASDAAASHVQHYEIAVESKKLSKTQQKKLEKSLDLNLDKQAIALNFRLDEIESVRLDPHLDFKGKSNHE
jgi:ribosome maturation factor RimP